MAKVERAHAVWEKPALVRADQTLPAVMTCNCTILAAAPGPVAAAAVGAG